MRLGLGRRSQLDTYLGYTAKAAVLKPPRTLPTLALVPGVAQTWQSSRDENHGREQRHAADRRMPFLLILNLVPTCTLNKISTFRGRREVGHEIGFFRFLVK